MTESNALRASAKDKEEADAAGIELSERKKISFDLEVYTFNFPKQCFRLL